MTSGCPTGRSRAERIGPASAASSAAAAAAASSAADESSRAMTKHRSQRITDRVYPDDELATDQLMDGSKEDGGGGERGHGVGVGGASARPGNSTMSCSGNRSDSKRNNPSEEEKVVYVSMNNSNTTDVANNDISSRGAVVTQSATGAPVRETERVGDSSTAGTRRRPTLDVPSTTTAPTAPNAPNAPTSTAASNARGNSASLSSNSSAITNASSGRSQMKVIYYQNRFIAIPIPPSTPHDHRHQPSDDVDNDVTSGSVNPLADDDDDGNVGDRIGAHQYDYQHQHPHHAHHHHHNHPDNRKESFQTNRKSYLVLRFIELLHDKDKPPSNQRMKSSKSQLRSRATLALVKCLNLFFLAMGILLFVGVLVAIAFSSILQSLNPVSN